ncbi:GNAT family N-acetyltransferase [Flavobacterium sp. IMCC34852]|uniref:GNAT family N-acetyltransferase n=2 Tax=Flavobacterium rivulicola TaxID=2732161 RepID=A0A7Y3R9A8_9FLAO|nr:GNAT family N-acetyltransferase [Flavobacterium sp. IMCC34852]NNT71886.1 GNAT family N-acetyltransferase [Flavobacterium sp. IMCC34852]
MPTIRKISAQEAIIVRHPVLRDGKPIESCHFDGDDLTTTQHFGLYESEILQGVISLFENIHPLFEEKYQMQIRGMAVLENNQGKGFGKLLVTHSEQILKTKKTDLIWFNARENAVGFYQKMGYEIIGNSFDIPNVGIHYVMWKKLGR